MTRTTIKAKSNAPLAIGRHIVFLHANDIDVNKELESGDLGTITDLSPLSRSNRRLISVDWLNGSSMALIEGKDTYKILLD